MMRTLALDVGTKTIGVAVSDELGITEQGVTTIKRKNFEYDKEELARLIDRFSPSEILLAFPTGATERSVKGEKVY